MDPKNYNTIYGECRCCLTKGHHKDIMKEYYWNGSREVYYDIFMECFNLFLSTNTNLSTLICSPCVQKLRDANSFRTMVASTEQKLLQTLNDDQTVFVNVGAHTLDSDIKLEDVIEVKEELTDLEENEVMDYDNDPDYLPSDEHCVILIADNDSPDVTSNISRSINKARTSNFIKQHQISSRPSLNNLSYAPSDTSIDKSFDSIIYEKNRDETHLPSTDEYKANSSLYFPSSSNLSNGTSIKSQDKKCISSDHTLSTKMKDTSDCTDGLPTRYIEYDLDSNEISLIIQNTETVVTEEINYTKTPQDTIKSDPLAICSSPLTDVASNVTAEENHADESIAPSTLNEHLISTISFDNSFMKNLDTSNVPESTQARDNVYIPLKPSEESSPITHSDTIITRELIENSDTSKVLESNQARDEVYIPPIENEESDLMTNSHTITAQSVSSCSLPIREHTTSPLKHKRAPSFSPNFNDIANSDVLNSPDSTISQHDNSDTDPNFCRTSIEPSSGSSDEEKTNDTFNETKHQFQSRRHHLGEIRDLTRKRKENTTNITNTYRHKSARVRTKDFCFFCKTSVLNFARHIIRKHAMEPEVQKILSYPKKSCTRKNLITTLRKKGNYVINVSKCIKPMKKNNTNPHNNYLPCVKCLGFYARNQLWNHKRKCRPLSETSNTQAETQNFMMHRTTRNRKENTTNVTDTSRHKSARIKTKDQFQSRRHHLGEIRDLTRKRKENTTNITDTHRHKSARVRTKDFCFFCKTSVLNFSRHIIRNHVVEPDVQKILSYPKKSCTRKNLIATLRKKGNYVINVSKCIKPMRKSITNPHKNYLPCVKCLGFYARNQLWKHKRKCRPLSENSNPQVEAQNFMLRNLNVDSKLKKEVFPKMRPDRVSLEAKEDQLICEFGAQYLRIHREKHVINVTSRKMRELAKLLIELKKMNPSIKDLMDCLKPQNYDLIVTATKKVSRYDDKTDRYGAPTYAMNISTSLKQCCNIAIMTTLKSDVRVKSSTVASDFKTLITLIESNWKFDVSSRAWNDLNLKSGIK